MTTKRVVSAGTVELLIGVLPTRRVAKRSGGRTFRRLFTVSHSIDVGGNSCQGASGDLIKAAVDNGAKGVIIAGAGAGATSGTQGEGITYATQKGVFIVTTTRTGGGGIGVSRGASLRIQGEDLQPIKARILLMLALATTTDPAEVGRMFREY